MNQLRISLLCLLALATTVFSQSDFAAWDDFLDQAKKDIKSDSIITQIDAIEGFRKEDHRKSAELLITLIKQDRIEYAVLRRAAEILSGFQNENAVRALADEVQGKPNGNHFLLQAYLSTEPEDRAEIALDALHSGRDTQVQRIALEGLKHEESLSHDELEKILPYLEEKNYHAVRKSCALVLGHLKSTAQIPVLISYLEDKVIGDKARDALLRLTGEEFWRDTDSWGKWWAENEATYEVEPMDETTFLEAHARLMEDMGDNEMRADFYERDITGKNIVFILDKSSSMKTNETEGGVTRMEQLKTELTYMVDRLDEDYSIGFVMFPHAVFPRRGIEELDKSFRKEAAEFIEKQKGSGGTPMKEGIEYAFTEIVESENVDTIYLLSDGKPSEATTDEIEQLTLAFADRYGVTVNTISIGRPSSMLEEIAKISGGEYWESH